MQHKININKQKLNEVKSRYIFTNPASIYQAKDLMYNALLDRLKFSVVNLVSLKSKKYENIKQSYIFKNPMSIIEKKSQKYLQIISKLETLSPLLTIKRGYSIVKCKDRVVTSSKDLNKKDIVSLQFDDGTLDAEII